MRILALASTDVLFTLPLAIVNIALTVTQSSSSGPMPFYFGWTSDHGDWEPESLSYASLVAQGTFAVAQNYFSQWTSPVLAFVIFGLFGVTSEARASYWRIICTVCDWFGFELKMGGNRARTSLGDIQFGERPPRDHTSFDLDVECVSVSPSYILR